MKYDLVMGIDIGSETSKGVIIKDGQLVADHLIPSGANYRMVVKSLVNELLAKKGLSSKDIAYTVATGLSTFNVMDCNQQIDDIRCCAKGIHSLFSSVRTIIDVQGQSSQIIRLSENGQVINYIVNEKCASGSGRFLEVIANILQLELKDIGPLSLKSQNPVSFTTGCVVFSESEAISRVAEGISKEDILAGAHKGLADRLSALIDRIGMEEQCAISGGGALNMGIVKRVEENLAIRLLVPPQPQLVNALGAALIGEELRRSDPLQQPLI